MKVKKLLIMICVLTVLTITVISLDCGDLTRRVQAENADFLIMIDPGHGGMDGGAVSSSGTLEKDINLAVAKKLADAAEQYGCAVLMTRETDEWLCDTDDGSIRSRKTADLMARRQLIRKYEPDITVSVHLNSFKEDPSVRGAQVFYPGSAVQTSGDALQQSRELAETMQGVLNETLQPDSPRTAMTRDGVFIFKEVEHPVIIVECGFMSNSEEAEKLESERYQKELAQQMMVGIAGFANLKMPVNVEIIDSNQ